MTDLYDDPFAEEIGDHLAYALGAAETLYERAATARQRFLSAAKATSKNVLAISARKVLDGPLAKLAEAVLLMRIDAGHLRASSDPDGEFIVWAASYRLAMEAYQEVERIGALALTPDDQSAASPEPPLPAVQDWATVAAQVQLDIAAWATSVRGQKGKLLIAKPSPGTGKTKGMVDTALREQAQRQRVVIAARTKQVLTDELEPRVRATAPWGHIRLHVIQGRDESTCWNFDNVKAVQEHGYSPGSTVCSRCEYHPDVAKKLRTFTVCPYYRTRQQAQNDSTTARLKLNDYPLILTTHAGYMSAVESGGGRFGKFWPCDLLMVDEDPTETFEPEVIITDAHLTLPTPPKPEDRAAYAMASLMRAAMDQATLERKAAEARGWKDDGKPSVIHGRHGSAYAGRALHQLIERAAAMCGFRSAVQVLRDVSDAHVHPAAGALHGATTADAVSLVVPPRGLSQIGEALFEDNALRLKLRRLAHKRVHKADLPMSLTTQQLDDALAESEEFDAAYRVRLEFVVTKDAPRGRWRFVLQNFVSMLDQGTNIIEGDAYANIEHYRQLYDKPATNPADPNYTDPVTVVDHVAKFPEGSLVARVRTRANITYLLNDGWVEHAAILSEVFRTHAGQRVLVYGHSVLKERIEKLFANNNNFGVSMWAFENWGGGRGKDHYADWDAVVTISDYIQNIGGMLHKVNARAARDTERLLARGKTDEALVEGTRIHLDMNKVDIAHKMADSGTHWRLKQEHERQNISELAQALHRVRGLRSPKRMTVVGDGVPFTRDTVAASATVNPVEGPVGRSKLKSSYVDGYLTEDEAYIAICQIEEHFGCWSPMFLHAFFAFEMGLFLEATRLGVTGCQGVQAKLYRDSLYRVQPEPPDNLSHHPDVRVPGAHLASVKILRDGLMEGVAGSSAETTTASPPAQPATVPRVVVPLTLLQRVWFPPAEWKSLYQIANQRLQRTKAASRRASREFTVSGRYVPTWEDSTHPGYMWYSRRSLKAGFTAAVSLIENQYGINRNGVLYAPNQQPFVPF